MERRQRRPRTEYILPQLRLYIRHPNAIEHAANLPAGSAQCTDGNAERRYGIRLSQRCAGHKSNGEYTHRQACERRRHAHNHLLLHAKRQPARRHRNADGYGNGNGYPYCNGNAYTDVDIHCHRDGNSDIDIYAHRNCHAYRHGYGNRNADGYTYRYAHGNGYTYIDRNRYAHANAHRYANAYSYA